MFVPTLAHSDDMGRGDWGGGGGGVILLFKGPQYTTVRR